MSTKRNRAYVICALVYLAATLVAALVVVALDPMDALWRGLWADVAATVVVFAASVRFDNSSLYDPYWSVAPVLLAVFWALDDQAAGADCARQLLVVGLVGLWGARLTWNFLRGWPGLHHEDWRYVDLRAKSGRAYWLVSFVGIQMMPTLLVFAGCLSIWTAVATGTQPLSWLDGLAAVVTLAAIVIEATADAQLRRFVQTNTDRARYLDTGLWALSRHPNYFGEISLWWGLWLFAMAADPTAWWTIAGPLAITGLFVFISLPLIETRMLERRPHYIEHVRRTSAIVPLPRRTVD